VLDHVAVQHPETGVIGQEGDLLGQAGVPYTWGRESSSEYGEPLAGASAGLSDLGRALAALRAVAGRVSPLTAGGGASGFALIESP